MADALEGIRVIDFCWVVAGPQVTRCLADFGATVIRVESHVYPDILRTTPPYRDNIPGLNRSGYFANYNANKYGISLNLNHQKGVEIARRLISWADILVENFGPGRMSGWGLGYEDIVKFKSDIIMASISIQGQTGPHAKHPGFAQHAEALSGFHHMTGWSDRMPTSFQGVFGDILTPRLALCATLAALDYRAETGQGQYIDVSQLEVAPYFFAPLLLDFHVNNREASRIGNRSTRMMAPHGVYPCRGEERWCAIIVSSDDEWHNLCQVMGCPEWCREERFATFLGRKSNEEELDKLIASWTMSFSPDELMNLLQEAGVPAGAVLNSEDVARDAQLKHRDAVWFMEHPEIGYHGYDTWSFRLSKTQATARMPAPCLGEHNYQVATQILGINDEEFAQLVSDGVFD